MYLELLALDKTASGLPYTPKLILPLFCSPGKPFPQRNWSSPWKPNYPAANGMTPEKEAVFLFDSHKKVQGGTDRSRPGRTLNSSGLHFKAKWQKTQLTLVSTCKTLGVFPDATISVQGRRLFTNASVTLCSQPCRSLCLPAGPKLQPTHLWGQGEKQQHLPQQSKAFPQTLCRLLAYFRRPEWCHVPTPTAKDLGKVWVRNTQQQGRATEASVQRLASEPT